MLINGDLANKIWRQNQLNPKHFTRGTDNEVIKWIDSELLPPVIAMVDGSLNEALSPSFTYPLSDEIIKLAYPKVEVTEITSLSTKWKTWRELAIKYYTLADLYLAVDLNESNDFYLKKQNEYYKRAEKIMESLFKSLKLTTSLIPVESGGPNGNLMLLTIKLKKESTNQLMELQITTNAYTLRGKYYKRESNLKRQERMLPTKYLTLVLELRRKAINDLIYLKTPYQNSKYPLTRDLYNGEKIEGDKVVNTSQHASQRYMMTGNYKDSGLSKDAKWVEKATRDFEKVNSLAASRLNYSIMDV